ncbi:RNA polymerase sigma factor [Brachybacterium hainanense]|uniref:RNA polymerase sigma factor n=1 Tax=Brachybacterium hainanense TaxID=1541174 RepID=A0ABV6R8D3_9MICO
MRTSSDTAGGGPEQAAARRRAAAAEAVAAAHRAHWGRVLAATLAVSRDLDLAEDCVQEAMVEALSAWAGSGIPANPGGWLTTTARRRALDAMRRAQTLRRKLPLLVWDPPPEPSAPPAGLADEEHAVVLDEQLRLIFLAAHPALNPPSRIVLTLRLVGGLSTAQIAAAFLVPEPTMAARLTRAKKRIQLSRIPCRVPNAEELPARLSDVLDIVSILLLAGERDGGEEVLAAGARILEILRELVPGQTEVTGLLAQALLLQARSATRHDDAGRPVALAEQDRSRWDRELVARADRLVLRALAAGGRGPYLLQGAIAAAVAVPERHEDVDWDEVVALYDALLAHWPTAIVRLARLVALAEARGPGSALAGVDQLATDLAEHRPFHVIRAELLTRVGRHEEAAQALRTALACRGAEGEDALLRERLGAAGVQPRTTGRLAAASSRRTGDPHP